MSKKLKLFFLGLIFAVGIFIAYQKFVGGGLGLNIFMSGKNPKPSHVTKGSDVKDFVYEVRSPDGKLLYVFTSKTANPTGQGHYDLLLPHLKAFTSDGQIIEATSDTGTAEIDQLSDTGHAAGGDLFGQTQIFAKAGSMSGHVIITIGPPDSYVPGSNALQPGQTQAHFDKPLEFNYQQRYLSSAGGVHIRGDKFDFDGSDLTASFNSEQRRVEFLRIVHGEKLVLKNLAAPINTAATPDNTTATPAPQSTSPSALATTGPAPTTSAAAPATAPAGPVAYHVTFKDNIQGHWDTRTLAADSLSLFFHLTGNTLNEKPAATQPASQNPANPAPVTPNTSTVAAIPPPDKTSLVLTWSGPMDMIPVDGSAVGLINVKDNILLAESETKPVSLVDQPLALPGKAAAAPRILTGSKFRYHGATQIFQVENAPATPVDMDDPAFGHVVATGAVFDQLRNTLKLTGPGKLNMDKKAGTQPITATWQNLLDLTLVQIPDAADSTQSKTSIRRAIFTGDATIVDPSFHLRADIIDALMTPPAKSSGTPGQQALERAVATGAVHIESQRTADRPADIIDSDKVVLTTAVPRGGTTRQLNAFEATGNVSALTHDATAQENKPAATQKIQTDYLLADLEPKSKDAGGKAPEGDAVGNFAIVALHATGKTTVELTGYSDQTATAVADRLDANLKTGDAVLRSDSKDSLASVSQASNTLAGMLIKLNKTKQSASVPGPGQFTFLQPPAANAPAGSPPRPIRISWEQEMDFDQAAKVAHFNGNTKTELLDQPTQQSTLTANELTVNLMHGAKGNDDKSFKISELIADGNVVALGANLADDGTLLTRMLLKSSHVTYTQASNSLEAPVPGTLLFEDYRPDAAAAAPSTSQPALGKNNSVRGQTAFAWKGALAYNGVAGTIQLTKEVQMVHKPNKPYARKPNAPADPDAGLVLLFCQTLDAKLDTKSAPANPTDLGSSGPSKISHVTAQGDTRVSASLRNDMDQINADVLDFDAPTNIVIAQGRNRNPATAFKINGPGIGTADTIKWDLTQGDSGFSFTQLRVLGNTP